MAPNTLLPRPPRRVHLDALVSEDHLYRGVVADYFLDKEGRLSGLFLHEAKRFDRRRYVADESAGKVRQLDQYWKNIPGENLYLPYERVISLNIRYVAATGHLLNEVRALLKRLKINATVDVGPVEAAPQE